MMKLSEIEKAVESYENGEKQLTDDDLIELADDLLQFDPSKDWWGALSHFREPACGYFTFYTNKGSKCEDCSDDKQLNCEYIQSIGRAVYIYQNLVKDLPEDRKTLCAFLSNC